MPTAFMTFVLCVASASQPPFCRTVTTQYLDLATCQARIPVVQKQFEADPQKIYLQAPPSCHKVK